MELVTLKSLFPVLLIPFALDSVTIVDFSCLNISVRCHIKYSGLLRIPTEGQESFERYISGEAAGAN